MLNFSLLTIDLSCKAIEFNNSTEPQLAVWWFIPAIVGGIVAAVAIIVIIAGDSPKDTFKNEKYVNLAILGPNETGKTTLWNFFRGRPTSKVYQETDGKVSISFKASAITWNAIKSDDPEDKKIKISGCDINGNGDFIRTDWEKMIEKSNMIIFIFNANKYLKNSDYQRDINQRMQLVRSTVDKQSDGKTRGIWLLGSYADLLANRKDDWAKIIGIIKTKPYCEISHNNACLNLTKEDELKEYYSKLFNS